MSNAEPKTVHFLEEAFELLGKHLYGSEWTGWELTASPVDDPDAIERKRAEFGKQIEGLHAEITVIDERIAATVDAVTIEKLQDRRAALLSELGALHSTLSDLPVIDDRHRQRHRTFLRRQNAEAILVDALSAGDLQAWATRGLEATGIPKHLWQGEKGFQYYLELSLVVLPRQEFGKRRGSVKLRSAEFDAWLMTVERIVVDPETPLSPEEQATIWFRRFIEQQTGTPPKRDYALHRMKLEVHDLSGAGALRVWQAHAPKHWKTPGPRSAKIR